MKTGDRIKELRKAKNLTQLELANKLNITDKAVSKWESNQGDPSIDLLIELSKVFDVSIDYLLTGTSRETIRYMSFIERVAYEDNPGLITKNSDFCYDIRDIENLKNLVDYVYQYEAVKTFVHIATGPHKAMLIKDVFDQIELSGLVKMSLISGHFDLISPNVGNPFVPLYLIQVVDDVKKAREKHIPGIGHDIVDFILHSKKISESTWDWLLDTQSLYWGHGMSQILEMAVKEKHPMVQRILDAIQPSNEAINELIKNNPVDYRGYHRYALRDSMLCMNEKPYRVYMDVTKETVMAAMGHDDEALVARLNELSGFKVSAHELKMDKVNKSESMSRKEKLLESVLHDGIVHINELIALDDYALYLEGIEYPASTLEKCQALLKRQDYKTLFQIAIDLNLGKTLQALRTDDVNGLDKALDSDLKQTPSKPGFRTRNSSQDDDPSIRKRRILFKDIMSHQDPEFFKHACKTDITNLDWALEMLVTTRPQDYVLQKLLLDRGAKLHKRWKEDDGWGDMVKRDVVDEVATELLKNQIQILMKEDKKDE
jgi:transcriptional regulator with XRE-family HTH domain